MINACSSVNRGTLNFLIEIDGGVPYIIEEMNSSCVNERRGPNGAKDTREAKPLPAKGSRNFNAQDDRIIIITPRPGLRGRKPDVAPRAPRFRPADHASNSQTLRVRVHARYIMAECGRNYASSNGVF